MTPKQERTSTEPISFGQAIPVAMGELAAHLEIEVDTAMTKQQADYTAPLAEQRRNLDDSNIALHEAVQRMQRAREISGTNQ